MNPGKTQLINFSQRKVISETSIRMYVQPLKINPPVKFLGVIVNNHLSMKLYLEHIERACLVNRMNITRLNSTNANQLIHFYNFFCGTVHGLCFYSSNCTKQDTET